MDFGQRLLAFKVGTSRVIVLRICKLTLRDNHDPHTSGVGKSCERP